MFIHDAVLEWLTCGDTQIASANLRKEMAKLEATSPDTALTGYQQQFNVSIILYRLEPACVGVCVCVCVCVSVAGLGGGGLFKVSGNQSSLN